METSSPKPDENPDPASVSHINGDGALNDRIHAVPREAQAVNGPATAKSNPGLDASSRAIFYLMRAALQLFSLLPDFILYRLGMLGGLLGFKLDKRHVKIALTNLAIAFPERSEDERRRILRASYINLGKSGAEYVRLAGFFRERLRDRVSYDGYDYWQQIMRDHPGRGLVVLTAHFGNFELLQCAHAMYGHRISLVHHTQSFAAGDALMTWVRERCGVRILRKHSAARAVLKALRGGDMVGIPFDQNAKRSEAVWVPFFGEPAATASGLARMVSLTGAGVIPAFIVRQADGRHHHIEIQQELPLQHTDDTEADVLENTRRFVKAVEDQVRRYPEQFLWTHRRYRTRPRGLASVYDKRLIRDRRSDTQRNSE
ncbi:MAG TPA: lysophospholipid acyltransferase family protein [Candidatus Binataceae bacterium]|nr:lysophospholipid acyltransferase family protein [Candidatus Binataceae bacterium]